MMGCFSEVPEGVLTEPNAAEVIQKGVHMGKYGYQKMLNTRSFKKLFFTQIATQIDRKKFFYEIWLSNDRK